MTDELQKHLDSSLYGTPRIKPDEQKKYMGTFKERCYVTMTIAQMKNQTDRKNFLTELKKYSDGTVLLNGKMDISLQTTYIKLIKAQGNRFTIVSEAENSGNQSLGLIIAASEAVDEEEIDIEKKYPQSDDKQDTKEAEQKKSFWKNLFK
ncbi:YueI family protein [Enterococcus sp. BWB1-3]|uniref:YueI family protein n=1 Tax=unclassified Enterococcus TaxID=2608891 RepID=UPI0019229FB0|nr:MULTISPECIES: YueI family protein [unclassified Enterococcus]MBL1228323.1 YueI family protein [Enterococcus sp. BWB1-3]MCB5951143.1 YueI family protein [Enterococcus sp. BWT-B8]MCB5954914.1 YueI family protein [Enterococcus sp. CWB-B31]